LRILIFNLRDIRNPRAGGAEVFTHQVARRWASVGNEVTLVASRFPGGKRIDTIDGVNVIRLGNLVTVCLLARNLYRSSLKSMYDLVIDEYTVRPFGTPGYVQEPVMFLVHELAREKFYYSVPPILSHALYYVVEPGWMSKYKSIPTVTISESTKQDLHRFGFENVHLVPVGLAGPGLRDVPVKEDSPTMLYVGLLKRTNLVEDAIDAFREVADSLPSAQLWVVGRGPALESLKRRALGTNTTFFGYVPEEKKLQLMMRSHLLLVPAVREGWGLVVTEASACGTPAVGYRVPGLVDSIKHGVTGMLTEANPHSLAEAAITLLQDGRLRQNLAENGLRWSREFSWERTSCEFLKVAERVAAR